MVRAINKMITGLLCPSFYLSYLIHALVVFLSHQGLRKKKKKNMEIYEMKILETDILELNDNIDQSELSSQALNRYIEISTHYINMEKVEEARKILISIGFTKKSVEKYIIRTIQDAQIHISEDFKLLMKGKVSKRYLN